MNIGQKIRLGIENSRYTVSDVASMMNVSSQNLYKIFKKESIDTKQLMTICKILDLDVLSVLSDDDSTPLPRQQELSEIHRLREEKHELLDKYSDLLARNAELIEQIEDKRQIISLFKAPLRALVKQAYVEAKNQGIDVDGLLALPGLKELVDMYKPEDMDALEEIFEVLNKQVEKRTTQKKY